MLNPCPRKEIYRSLVKIYLANKSKGQRHEDLQGGTKGDDRSRCNGCAKDIPPESSDPKFTWLRQHICFGKVRPLYAQSTDVIVSRI